MTAFARMNQSDHSLLSPAPAATIVYQSPLLARAALITFR